MKHGIGVDIGGTNCTISLFDCDVWQLLDKWEFPAEPDMRDYVRKICHNIDKLKTHAVQGIGVCCGGPLDSQTGCIHSPPHLPQWNEVPIVDFVHEHTGTPVWLQNDANAAALAEWYWGAGKGTEDFILVTFSTGFGAGIIAGGQLIEGHNGQAGEIGHVRLHDEGPMAYGKDGSAEAFCSGGSLEQIHHCSTVELFGAAHEGQPDALRLVNEIGTQVGRALAILVDLLNPERIALGTIYCRNQELLNEPIQAALQEEALTRNVADVEIVPAALNDELGNFACMAVVRRELQAKS